MKRLALVLTVAALAAVSCTTPGAVPVTTSSSSTTQAGATAREAVFDGYFLRNYGLDSSYYPSGSEISTQTDVGGGSYCATLGTLDINGAVVELPGSRNCGPFTAPPGRPLIAFSVPVPLPAGVNYFFGGRYDQDQDYFIWDDGAPVYVRW